MIFNSQEFLLIFLPVVLAVFHLLQYQFNPRIALSFLVLGSLVFYGYWKPIYLALILASVLTNFLIGHWISHSNEGSRQSKILLWFGIILNLAALGFFKYSDFFLETYGSIVGKHFGTSGIILPLAISFFTFQQIAFLVDVYRNQTRENDLVAYALFVTYFPQLLAGPIVRHSEVIGQFKNLAKKHHQIWVNLAVGATIFTIGLFKKVVLAEKMKVWADQAFFANSLGVELSFLEAWVGTLCFSFQIYFDFSGYSDMAIGLARLFGIILPLNFASPYKATSIIEFWQSWHMTLSRFLRDYLYFPLGGNRNGPVRRYINLFVVMALGGLWHGASWTFVLWGLLHGFFLTINHAWSTCFVSRHIEEAAERYSVVSTIRSWLGRIITFVMVTLAWVPFRADSIESTMGIYRGMFGINGVVVPTQYQLLLGEIGETLVSAGASFGATPTYGGGWQVVWIISILLFVWLLPNTQQIMHFWSPGLADFRIDPPKLFQFRLPSWQPSIWLGALSGFVFLMLVMKILQGESGEFIYFQF